MNKLALYAAAVLALSMPMTAMAQAAPAAVDVSGLSAEQIADLQAKANEAKQTPQAQAKSTVEKVNEWAEIGTGIGSGLAAAARETGSVVNDFASTPVGKMTTAVIIWKVMGKDILGILVGVPLLIAFWSLWIFFTQKHLTAPWSYEYITDEKGKQQVKSKKRNPEGLGIAKSDMSFMWVASWAALAVGSAFILGFIIF